MAFSSRRRVLAIGLMGAACACAGARVAFAADSPSGKYVCPPCGCSADGKEFDKPGDCPACGMPLMAKPAAPSKPAQPEPPKTGDAAPGALAANVDARDGNGWGTRART